MVIGASTSRGETRPVAILSVVVRGPKDEDINSPRLGDDNKQPDVRVFFTVVRAVNAIGPERAKLVAEAAVKDDDDVTI